MCPIDASEIRLQVENINTIRFAQAVEYLKSQKPGFAIFDVDGTIRPLLKYGLKGRFGKIPKESIE